MDTISSECEMECFMCNTIILRLKKMSKISTKNWWAVTEWIVLNTEIQLFVYRIKTVTVAKDGFSLKCQAQCQERCFFFEK